MQANLHQVLSATNARLCNALSSQQREQCSVSSVCWDSRNVAPASLYVALVGAKVDGHNFIADAVRSGAHIVVTTHDIAQERIQEATQQGCAVVRCDDAVAFLEQLAAWWRTQLSATIVAITGSTGKTTTKNLVAEVLGAAGSVCATLANQNNELGVPNTVLRAEKDDRFVVVEMGMRGFDQIRHLCSWVKPHWALISNVGTSHIELLGSRDGIAHAKSEIFEQLPVQGGRAFLNACDDFLHQQRAYGKLAKRQVPCVYFNAAEHDESLRRACAEGGGVLFVGAHDVQLNAFGQAQFSLSVYASQQRIRALQEDAAVLETSISSVSCAQIAQGNALENALGNVQGNALENAPAPDAEHTSDAPAFTPDAEPTPDAPAPSTPNTLCEQDNLYELRVQQPLTLSLCGSHNVSNALCAIAVGIEAGIPLSACLHRVQHVQPADGRQKFYQGIHLCTVIDDAYNANPDSMRAALRVVKALKTPGKRIAVLGDMGELGSYAVDMHRDVGKFAAHCGIDVLVCVGEHAQFIAEAAQSEGFPSASLHTVSCAQQALDLLKPLISAHDVVLVKASHSMHLETIVKGLLS